eukprot:CAMPEP_0119298532 /NCGR_PEP_ID=MMETSP1333-20130426/702_1 /TAXON_ID=418940 /ORGANISM="Scyphosphaera apsteinii, Strain RCC1455" /LENGTH=151 /DNA_ID=CAMNT_0007299655 /DNA_START=195 /DNA_END=647 /DNA_ORIENTATION=+
MAMICFLISCVLQLESADAQSLAQPLHRQLDVVLQDSHGTDIDRKADTWVNVGDINFTAANATVLKGQKLLVENGTTLSLMGLSNLGKVLINNGKIEIAGGGSLISETRYDNIENRGNIINSGNLSVGGDMSNTYADLDNSGDLSVGGDLS